MDLPEALQRLGLDDIDTQLRASNVGKARQGATTWMLVEAARALLEGKKVVLIGHTLAYTKDYLVRTCLAFATKLGAHVTNRHRRRADISTGGILFWESERTVQRFWVGKRPEDFVVFSDGEYRCKAYYRAQGPFAQVRLITAIDADADHYGAYDEDDVFLFDLPGKTVDELLAKDPYRIQYTGPPRPV